MKNKTTISLSNDHPLNLSNYNNFNKIVKPYKLAEFNEKISSQDLVPPPLSDKHQEIVFDILSQSNALKDHNKMVFPYQYFFMNFLNMATVGLKSQTYIFEKSGNGLYVPLILSSIKNNNIIKVT